LFLNQALQNDGNKKIRTAESARELGGVRASNPNLDPPQERGADGIIGSGAELRPGGHVKPANKGREEGPSESWVLNAGEKRCQGGMGGPGNVAGRLGGAGATRAIKGTPHLSLKT